MVIHSTPQQQKDPARQRGGGDLGDPRRNGHGRPNHWGAAFALSTTTLLSAALFSVGVSAEEPSPKQHKFGPHYKASSSDARAKDISKNAYGAYSYAPKAPKIGDRLANIQLPAVGGDFDLDKAKAKGPVVIVFYRGFW